MGFPKQDPVYGAVEVMTPGELQGVGLGAPGPLAASQSAQAAPGAPIAQPGRVGPLSPPPTAPRSLLSHVLAPDFLQTETERMKKGQGGPLAAGLRLTGLSPETAGGVSRGVQDIGTQLVAPVPASMLGRSALQGGLMGGQQAMEPGASPLSVAFNTILGAGTGAVGPLQGITSKGKYGRVAKEQAQKLVDWFHTEVPAWKDFTGSRALYRMGRHPEGQERLSTAYQSALDATKEKIPPGLNISVHEDVARAAGIEVPKTAGPALTPAARAVLERAGKLPPGPAAGTIEVNARQLVDALPTFGKERSALKHEAMDLLAKSTGGVQALKDANAQYMKGSAWMELSKKLFQKGERFDPVEAQTVLRTRGKEILGPRGMGSFFDLMRGPGEKEIEKVTRPLWERALTGAKAGGLAGAATGGVVGTGAGAGLGAVAGTLIPKFAYKNLPNLPASERMKLLYQLQQAAIKNAAGQYGPQ